MVRTFWPINPSAPPLSARHNCVADLRLKKKNYMDVENDERFSILISILGVKMRQHQKKKNTKIKAWDYDIGKIWMISLISTLLNPNQTFKLVFDRTISSFFLHLAFVILIKSSSLIKKQRHSLVLIQFYIRCYKKSLQYYIQSGTFTFKLKFVLYAFSAQCLKSIVLSKGTMFLSPNNTGIRTEIISI